jgi:hypothetical protein
MSWRARMLVARARRRLAKPPPDREQVVRRHAAGKTFLDVGCMWKVHGRIAFVAEEAGATEVTGMDVMAATPEFEHEHAERSSRVRFVLGDLHDSGVRTAAGPHDVVWCSGVLYHAPNPVETLAALRELTRETLILQTMTVPELPGVRQGMVLYPGLPERDRRLYDRWGTPDALRPPAGPRDYDPWWWGITPSALDSMLRVAGFEPRERWGDPFGVHVIASTRD